MGPIVRVQTNDGGMVYGRVAEWTESGIVVVEDNRRQTRWTFEHSFISQIVFNVK